MTRPGTYLLLSLSVLAMGIVSWSLKEEPTRGTTATVEEYWRRTGLKPSALEDLVDDDSCRTSQRYFLACVNALTAVAGRLDLEMTLDGRFKPAVNGIAAPTEKQLLEPWKTAFSEGDPILTHLSFRTIWRGLIRDHVEPDRRASMTGAALNAFLSVFRDPHTYILPVKYYEEVVAKLNALSSSMGIVLGRSKESYYLRKVIEGSPSAKAGLRRGDWVLAVNGVRLQSMAPQRLSELLRPEENPVTTMEVRREDRVFKIKVSRESATIPAVTWRRLEGVRPVGLLTINKFADETCTVVKESLQEMNRQRLRGLLIDVRDNTGGQMNEAACVVSLFVGPKSTAFRIRYLNPKEEPETYHGYEEKLWRGKVAVLINSGTASAAEILAGSLRDHDRAILVGERTFGKGSFQEGELWGRNSKIAFFQTKGFYYLPSGFSPQKRGIAPDVAVDFRDSIPLREEDQYFSSLNPPDLTAAGRPSRAVDLSSCLDADDVADEDPQMDKARTALFCGGIADRTHRAL